MSQSVKSSIARDLVRKYGRLSADPNVRHGSKEVARTCRCEVCQRAFPDNKKKHAMNVKAVRTSACTKQGAKGHPRCSGWRFDAGVNATRDGNHRGASPCQCGCHEDGRGRPVPTFKEWLVERTAENERHKQWLCENSEAVGQ